MFVVLLKEMLPLKRIFIFCYLLLLVQPAGLFAQDPFKLLATLPYANNSFTTDNQCNVYVCDKNELIKFDSNGKEICRYSNRSYGNGMEVDASNMLRLLVFYPDFMQAVFLDNTLSSNGEPLSFDKLGYSSVSLACTSHNNGIWLFDTQNSAIYQLNSNYQLVQKNEQLNVLLNQKMLPTKMVEYNNQLFLNNPSYGILIFDAYGTYFKSIPEKGLTCFQPFGDWLYYLKDGKVEAVQLHTNEKKIFELPVSNMRSFRIELNSIVIQTDDGIRIYSNN